MWEPLFCVIKNSERLILRVFTVGLVGSYLGHAVYTFNMNN